MTIIDKSREEWFNIHNDYEEFRRENNRLEELEKDKRAFLAYLVHKHKKPEIQMWQEETMDLTELLEENKKMRKALEFYADPYTWVTHSGKVGISPIDIMDSYQVVDAGAPRWACGKLAIEALKSPSRGRNES